MAENKLKEALTVRQKKKQHQKILAFKKGLNQKLEKKIKARRADVRPLPPRYDDVFFEGLAQLEKAAGAPPQKENSWPPLKRTFGNQKYESLATHNLLWFTLAF